MFDILLIGAAVLSVVGAAAWVVLRELDKAGGEE